MLPLSGFCSRTEAQLQPIKNVPSPEIAGLGAFGKIPVSLYTGIPDISIPLYEARAGRYALPISVSYHPSSVKANSPSGSLGLGWNLLAGGYITRSVRGIIDEKLYRLPGNVTVAPGYYANAYRLKEVTAETFPALNAHLLNQQETQFYELTADEFAFSFCGYSGNFYYNENGGWSVVSDQKIEVRFDPETDGFISPDSLNKIQRIDLGDWDNINGNDRFFNQFTLITPDGCQYQFGGPNATEFSAPYYHRKKSDLIPTTWRLKKIITVDKKTIEFEYDATSIVCDIKYVPQYKEIVGIPTYSYHAPSAGRAGMSGYLLFPVNIAKIKTPNETIDFTYATDAYFSDSFKINTKSYLGWILPGRGDENRFDLYSVLGDDDQPYNQFHVFLGLPQTSTFQNDAQLCEAIGKKLKNLILKSIRIRDRGYQTVKNISFGYQLTPAERRKLISIKEREGDDYVDRLPGEILPGDIVNPGDFEIYDPSVRIHRFTYHAKTKLPASLIHPEADPWGYYNGNLINIFQVDSMLFYPTIKNPDYAMADILTQIEYPTGGKTRFEYEPHSYSKSVDLSRRTLTPTLGKTGGLRIKSLTELTHDDSIVGIRMYHYSELLDAPYTKNSGILSKTPTNYVTYYLNAGKTKYVDLMSKGGFFASVTSQNTPDVGYSCVIEQTLNAQNESEGYTRYRYTNFDQDIHGQTHMDEPAWFCTVSGESAIKAYTSHSAQRGKLLSEEYFDRHGELRKKVTHHYTLTDSSYLVTADQIPLYLFSPKYQDIPIGTLTKTYQYSYLPDSLTEITFTDPGNIPVETKQTFAYNACKMLRKNTLTTSDGSIRTIEYEYNSDDPFHPHNGLGYALSLLTRKSVTQNRSTREESYTYRGVNGIPHLQRVTTRVNDDFPRTDYEVVSADDESLPMEIIERGLHSVLFWGFEGQKLIAKVENATWEQIESLPELAGEDFSHTIRLTYPQIESIRRRLPAARFYIYKYDDRLLLQSVTNPNGVTEFYNYDFIGRLTERYYIENTPQGWQKRLLSNYVYNYQ